MTAHRIVVLTGAGISAESGSGYVALASAVGARTIKLNLEPTDAAVPFDEPRDRGRARLGGRRPQRRVETVTVNFALRAI